MFGNCKCVGLITYEFPLLCLTTNKYNLLPTARFPNLGLYNN